MIEYDGTDPVQKKTAPKKRVQTKKTTQPRLTKDFVFMCIVTLNYYYIYSGWGGKNLIGQDDIPSDEDASNDGVDYFGTGNLTDSFILL